MSDKGAHTRQQDVLVSSDKDARVAPALTHKSNERRGNHRGVWPGLRSQGADLNGWLRFESAPLRSYDAYHARP
jgi:hypothetical protein